MRKPLLVINAGSSSIKFSIFETAPDRSLAAGAHGQVEGLGAAARTPARIEIADAQGRRLIEQPIAGHDHHSAMAAIHDWFAAHVGSEATFAHGLSYEYIMSVMPRVAPECAGGKLIVAHLGNGASMCAIAAGRSIATTMGMTALDGLPMGTRTGTLDPGVILYLLQHEGLDAKAVEHMIYEHSGLLGVSGLSSDMRTLLASDLPAAKEAVDLFVYRIGRELGSLAAALGGLDALVFTAGIGEHAAEIRARVCKDAAWIGVSLDDKANEAGGPRISRPASKVSAWVIPTDENLMIARHTRQVLDAALARHELR